LTVNEPFTISAVNYLNSVPLVWGMMHGSERSHVRMRFEIPSECARTIERGQATVGLVPVAEISRQKLDVVPGYGIACHGAVRSILLVSRKPIRQIQTLAADASSRTSVQLARVVLRETYGAAPEFLSRPPHLETMLQECDAALLIGDSALVLDPYKLPFEVLDLGAEWYALTGLPMVFALWAGHVKRHAEELGDILERSWKFGAEHVNDIVELEHERRHVSRELAHEYLTRYIHYPIGEIEWRGLEVFLELAGLNQVAAALAQVR
jgi:predicted solute-binding protein